MRSTSTSTVVESTMATPDAICGVDPKNMGHPPAEGERSAQHPDASRLYIPSLKIDAPVVAE